MADLNGRHILVVDDDASVRFILSSELEDAGCVVTEAADGAAALAVLGSATHFDLLVTDIRMPGIDGWKLAQRARAMRPMLPVLYVTGWSEDEPNQVPGSLILAKPFKPMQLTTAAAQLVSNGAALEADT